MEEEHWVQAACKVLSHSKAATHYTDIKRLILEQKLVAPGLKSTLEMALYKESQREEGRVSVVEGQPGVFGLSAHYNPATHALSQAEKGKAIGGSSKMSGAGRGMTTAAGPVSVSQNGTVGGGSVKKDKYHAKYTRLKRLVKHTVFLNAGICDEVVRLEEKVSKVKDERRFLLKRLLQQQALSEVLHQSLSSQAPQPPTAASASAPSTSALPPSLHPAQPRPSSQSVAQLLGEVEKRKKKTATATVGPAAAATAAAGGLKVKKKAVKEIPVPEEKPKPKKGKIVKRFVTPIPLDNTGRPIFPIELGTLTVYCLGEIIPKAGYCSSETIYPVGFCSTREYISIQNPADKCLYTCKVYDSNQGPKFEISAEDCPEHVISGSSPNECHLNLLQAINASIGQDIIPLECLGADFFGLSHPTIQNLIQYCPGAKKCHGYRWQKFEIAKDGAPHLEHQATVNVEVLQASRDFHSAVLTSQQRSAARSGSLRTLLTGDSGS